MNEVEPVKPATSPPDPGEQAREVVVKLIHGWTATSRVAGRIVGTALSPLPLWAAAVVTAGLLGVVIWLLALGRSYIATAVSALSAPAALVEVVVIAWVVTAIVFAWPAWLARSGHATPPTTKQEEES